MAKRCAACTSPYGTALMEEIVLPDGTQGWVHMVVEATSGRCLDIQRTKFPGRREAIDAFRKGRTRTTPVVIAPYLVPPPSDASTPAVS